MKSIFLIVILILWFIFISFIILIFDTIKVYKEINKHKQDIEECREVLCIKD